MYPIQPGPKSLPPQPFLGFSMPLQIGPASCCDGALLSVDKQIQRKETNLCWLVVGGT